MPIIEQMKAGERWHVSLPGKIELDTVLVKEVSDFTILIELNGNEDRRYFWNDITRIERASTADK